jgi:hypothetical protein
VNRRLRGLRSLVSLGLIAGVFGAAATVAPAQPVPVAPPAPGQGAPTTPPGPPSPLPAASFPALPSPEASATAPEQPSPAPSSPGAAPAPAASPAGPAAPAASPGAPAAALLTFSGQLLDLRNGFVYFTTADAFKAAPTLRIVDFDTGGPTALVPGPRIYARATLDPATGAIVELALTKRRLATDAAYQQAYARAHAFVVAGSATVPAPELNNQVRLTGRRVAVTFYVQVPPTTPLTDSVYITTDASGWVANAMKMDRIDALHYRLTRAYASGTKFAYRYTRGSWTSVEVGEDGLQGDPHQFFVPEVDAKRLTDVVYRWSDQNPVQPQVGPDSIPTPFNPNPFGGLPTTVRPGVPQPTPTPRP